MGAAEDWKSRSRGVPRIETVRGCASCTVRATISARGRTEMIWAPLSGTSWEYKVVGCAHERRSPRAHCQNRLRNRKSRLRTPESASPQWRSDTQDYSVPTEMHQKRLADSCHRSVRSGVTDKPEVISGRSRLRETGSHHDWERETPMYVWIWRGISPVGG